MWLADEQRGQGLVEYVLLLMLVFMVVLFVLIAYGAQVGNTYSRVTNQLGTIP